MRITKVMLKDGRLGSVRESITTIKYCKRNRLTMLVFIDGGDKAGEETEARNIVNVLENNLEE